MKKKLLTIALVSVSLSIMGSKAESKYPDYVPNSYAELFASERIDSFVNTRLNEQLEDNFAPLFDRVLSVDVQYSELNGSFSDKRTIRTRSSY